MRFPAIANAPAEAATMVAVIGNNGPDIIAHIPKYAKPPSAPIPAPFYL